MRHHRTWLRTGTIVLGSMSWRGVISFTGSACITGGMATGTVLGAPMARGSRSRRPVFRRVFVTAIDVTPRQQALTFCASA